jgi:hypothetical protein
MRHLAILRAVNWLVAGYTVLAGLLFLVLFLLPWLVGADGPTWAFALLGILGFVLIACGALVHVILGFLVGSGRGRLLQTIFALVQLLSFPVGTLYALYALWVCWIDPESTRRFESAWKPPV